MCVNLLLGDLNPNSFLPHSISTYTCRVTITSRVCGGCTISTSILPFMFYILNCVKNQKQYREKKLHKYL